MAVEVKMPKLGLTMEEGRIVKWLKNEGEPVEKDESILVIETEKLTSEIKSPVKGFLAKKLVKEGDVVKVGEIVAIIAETEEELEKIRGKREKEETVAEKAVEETKTREQVETNEVRGHIEKKEKRVRATPAARTLARKHGIRLEDIRGTGPEGIITYRDVKEYITRLVKAPAREVVAAKPAPVPEELEVVELTPMRRRIAENLAKSAQEMVLTTITMEVNVDEILYIREKMGDKKPTITAFIVKALAEALKKYRVFNAYFDGEKIILYKDINIGVAVALENGLVTPVIRNADEKTVSQISREIKELAEKARQNKLSVDDLSGATITFSNLGMYEVDVFTPIIYPGHVAVLGAGRVYDKLVLVEGEIENRKYMMLSLTFDHRAVDGAQAAIFLREIKRYLENPYLMIV